MMNVINKSLAEKKIVLTLTKEQVTEYIYEGKQQFKATHRIVMFVLFLCLFSSSFLLIILIWGVRPVKRK